MKAVLLISLAAFFKAVADTLQHHYYVSVFKNLNPNWWDPNESWKYVKLLPLTGYRPDAWHLANSFMIVCFILAIVLHQRKHKWWIELIVGGILFNLIFVLLYSIVLN